MSTDITINEDQLIANTSMQDLLLVANQISNETGAFIPPSSKATKEDLIEWISINDPNHDPEEDA